MNDPYDRRGEVLLYAVAFAHVLFDLAFAVLFRALRHTPDWGMGLLAFEMSQVSMLALWTATSQRSLLVRLAATVAGLGCLGTMNGYGMRTIDDGLGMAISFTVLWLGLHFAFVTTQRIFKRRLICIATEPTNAARATGQFGIGHLLTWTAFVAMALASTRLFGSELRDLRFMDYVVMPIVFATISGIIEAPAIFGLMAFRHVGAGFAFAAVWIGSCCALIIGAAGHFGAGGPALSIPVTWYVVSVFSLAVSLGLARSLGWRLDRTQSSA